MLISTNLVVIRINHVNLFALRAGELGKVNHKKMHFHALCLRLVLVSHERLAEGSFHVQVQLKHFWCLAVKLNEQSFIVKIQSCCN